jgi:RimJ/RimL family protein N-acetyltransferase
MLRNGAPTSAAERAAVLVIQLPRGARRKFAAHLLALSADDRRLRFGSAIADAAIENYARRIDFERDAVFGVYGANLVLVGACHVAQAGETAEFGVSVLPGERRQGVGSALVARAALHARNAGISALFMHCLSENRGIIRVARKFGMRIESEYGESDGRLELATGDVASLLDELTQQGIALYDYTAKAHLANLRNFAREAMPASPPDR